MTRNIPRACEDIILIQKLANEVLASTFGPNIRYIIRLSLNTVVDTKLFLNTNQISWIVLLLNLKGSVSNYT